MTSVCDGNNILYIYIYIYQTGDNTKKDKINSEIQKKKDEEERK